MGYKRVGNPIQWANPTGGGTIDDNSSKHWRWVYPVGATIILLLCLNSRRKSLKKEQEENMIQASNIRMPDTSGFTTPSTPAYVPPPPPPSSESEDNFWQKPQDG